MRGTNGCTLQRSAIDCVTLCAPWCKGASETYLNVTSFAGVAAGALAREPSNIVDALATINAGIGFALVVLEVAQLTGES